MNAPAHRENEVEDFDRNATNRSTRCLVHVVRAKRVGRPRDASVAAEVEEKSEFQRDNDVDVGVQGHDLHSDAARLAIEPL